MSGKSQDGEIVALMDAEIGTESFIPKCRVCRVGEEREKKASISVGFLFLSVALQILTGQ
jgi:hypothetical protein